MEPTIPLADVAAPTAVLVPVQDPALTKWLKILALELDDMLCEYELGIGEFCAFLAIDPLLGQAILDSQFIGMQNRAVYARLFFMAGMYHANPCSIPSSDGDPAVPLAWPSEDLVSWHEVNSTEIVTRRSLFTEVQKSRNPYQIYDDPPAQPAAQIVPVAAAVVTAPLPVVEEVAPPELFGTFVAIVVGVIMAFFGVRAVRYVITDPQPLTAAVGSIVLFALSGALLLIGVVVTVYCTIEFFRDLWVGHILRFFRMLRKNMESTTRNMMIINAVCLGLDAILLFGVAPMIPVFLLRWVVEMALTLMLIFFADALLRLRSRNNRQLLYIAMGSIGGAIAASALYFSELSNIYRAIPFMLLSFAIVVIISWKKPGAPTI